MTRKPRSALTFAVYGVSAAFHIAFAAAAVLAPKVKKSTVVAISLAEAHKAPPKPAPEPPPPPPPPVKEKPAHARAAAPKPAPEIPAVNPPPQVAADAPTFADLGLTMGNGPGGIAVPTAAAPLAPAARETTHTVRALAAAHEEACSEPVVKAKLRGALVKPIYTEEARTAQIEGVVRVEMTVDDLGNVISVKVLKGLGYGLDDAAVSAAKQMAFTPGTRCGKATLTKLTVGMRFSLQQ